MAHHLNLGVRKDHLLGQDGRQNFCQSPAHQCECPGLRVRGGISACFQSNALKGPLKALMNLQKHKLKGWTPCSPVDRADGPKDLSGCILQAPARH